MFCDIIENASTSTIQLLPTTTERGDGAVSISEIAVAGLMIIVGFIGLTLVVTMIIAMVRQSPTGPHVRFDTFEPTVLGAGWRSIIFLPGVQSRGNEALLPADWSPTDPAGVMGALRTYGRVLTATYVREKTFSPEEVVGEITALIRSELDMGKEVVLIGSSFGGMLAVDALEKIRGTDVSLILISSPLQAADLLGVGRFLGSVLKWTGLDWLLAPLLGIFHVPAGTIPAEAVQQGLGVRKVQASYRIRGSGFSLSGMLLQLGYIARWRYPVRMTSVPSRTHYIACMGDQVVRQPQTATKWTRILAKIVVHKIQAPHCECLGQPKIFIKTFGEIINP